MNFDIVFFVDHEAAPRNNLFADFLQHIISPYGIDHLLFVSILLLPSMFWNLFSHLDVTSGAYDERWIVATDLHLYYCQSNNFICHEQKVDV